MGLREVCVYAWLLCLVVVVGHLFSLIKLGPGGPHPPLRRACVKSRQRAPARPKTVCMCVRGNAVGVPREWPGG